MYRSVRLAALALLLFAACGDEKPEGTNGSVDPCDALACEHGRCEVADGVARCTCDQGYAGASCDVCADGYQDHDGDGTCEPECTLAGLACVKGACDDASGTARCICEPGYGGPLCDTCAPGFQDNDGDGICKPDCTTAPLSCVQGVCDDSSGTAVCACRTGYAGPACDICADGYQDNDRDGTCRPGCTLAGDACVHGTCDDSTGVAICVCDTGWAGASCDTCAPGFQDNDEDGVCNLDCTFANLPCAHGVCDDASGTALCACEEGYAGPLCNTCAAGYQDNDRDGVCTPDCTLAGLTCVMGSCDDSSGVPLCACDTGYTGAVCDQCAEGYQDNDEDGTCAPTCTLADLGCVRGVCDDASGTAVCVCEPTYSGALCDACAEGFQDNDGDGICAPDCTLADLGCVHGACDDASGTAVCACEVGYEGALCDTCADGYQDNDGDGTCTPSCALAQLPCGHGVCDDSSGIARCACDEGYQDNDEDGVCQPGCALTTCDDGYACEDDTGTAECVVVPPGAVARLTWTDRGEIVLYWEPPSGYWEAVRIVRSRTGFPSSPTDGDLIYEGLDTIVVDPTALPHVTYYYAAWAVSHGVYSPQPTTAQVRGDWAVWKFTQSGTFTTTSLLPYMTVYAWGAGGGGGRNPSGAGGPGGAGGFATATWFNPFPTEFRVIVGKAGRSGEPTAYDADDTVGRGAYGNCSDSYNGNVASTRGGGGGQMSGVSLWPITDPGDISNWIVIAGGGGGGSTEGSFAGGGGGGAAAGSGSGNGGGGGSDGLGGDGGPNKGYGRGVAGSSWPEGGHGGASLSAVNVNPGGYPHCGGGGGGGYGGGGGGAGGYSQAGGGGGGGGYATAADGVYHFTTAATGREPPHTDHPFYPTALAPGWGGNPNQDGNPGYVVVVEHRCPAGLGGPFCLDDVRGWPGTAAAVASDDPGR